MFKNNPFDSGQKYRCIADQNNLYELTDMRYQLVAHFRKNTLLIQILYCEDEMRQPHWSILESYAIGLLTFVAASILRIWLAPFEYGLPFLTFYPAMVIVFYSCGVGPGILVTLLSATVGFWLIIQSGGSYASGFAGEIATAIYLASAFFVASIIQKMRSYTSALEISEHRYERMLEDQTDLICRFRSDNTMLYVNDAYCRFFGKTRNELVGHKWHPLVAPGFASYVDQQLRLLTPDNPVVNIENPVIVGNDTVRWCHFVNRAFYDASSTLTEVQSVGRDITRQKELEQALSANEKEFRLLAEAMPQIVWITDPAGQNIYFNQQWVDYTGLTLEESHGSGWNRPFHPDDRQRAWDAWQNAVLNDGIYSLECRLRRADGEYRWWLVRGVPVLDNEGKIYKWFGTCTDIQEFKETEIDLSVAATAFDANVGIIVTDASSHIIRVNKAFTEQTGYSAEEVIGHKPRLLHSGRHDASFYLNMRECINRTGSWQGEVWDRRKDGGVYPKLLTVSAIKGKDGTVSRYVGTQVDITVQKAADEQIRKLAFYDPLTKLPNRRLLTDRLHHALASSARNGKGAALMFIDMDNFKDLNDAFGHAMGDLLLQQVALRLASGVRECDTVARLGGDEFVVMLEGLDASEIVAAAQTEEASNKIVAALSEPYQLADNAYHSTASVGCTVFFDHRYAVNEILQQADIAMYQAKRDGRNKTRFYDQQMQQIISSRLLLESEIRTALKRGQFHLFYQIQRDDSGLTLGAEALIRWNHPERGLIFPTDFIPLSEDSDLILDIGRWVLEEACAQIQKWQNNSLTRGLTISVNVSPKHFRQDSFVDDLRASLCRHSINPTLLKLELTESILLERVESTVSTMTRLKKDGVQFSLDDFGTGYSSLQYLKQLPFNQLKIPEPFIRDIGCDDNDRALVRTMISMGQCLNLEVYAEGVETEEQHQFLLENGCTRFQGYLFAHALPIQEFDALLESLR